MRGFQKHERNWIFTMAFWATCKIAQPIQPIWQHILPCLSLPQRATVRIQFLPYFWNFGIPSSSRHEKRCQILQTLFQIFQYSRNSHGLSSKERTASSRVLDIRKSAIIFLIKMYKFDIYWESLFYSFCLLFFMLDTADVAMTYYAWISEALNWKWFHISKNRLKLK